MSTENNRYYRVSISGYGGEGTYMSIPKAAYEFWESLVGDYGDTDLVTYMLEEDGDEPEYEDIDSMPEEAQFLHEDNYKRPWYESHTEFEHACGAEYGSAFMDINEVDSDDYDATIVNEIIQSKDIQELNEEIGEDSDWEKELVEGSECERPEGYVAQLYSREKGCFFEGTIKTQGEFDTDKLRMYTTEYLNGEYIITGVEYDGEEVFPSDGIETQGTGYYAGVWEN